MGKSKKRSAPGLFEPFGNSSPSGGDVKVKGDSFGENEESFEKFRQAALLSIVTHPMRSFLTAIGVFIGVASVIWLLAMRKGLRPNGNEIMAMGPNNGSFEQTTIGRGAQQGKYFYSYGSQK